jgi:endoglucanase
MQRYCQVRTGWLLFTSLTLTLVGTGCVSKNRRRAGQGADNAANRATPSAAELAHNLLGQSNFEDGTSLPWTLSFTPPAKGFAAVENGSYCLHVENKGSNKWDSQVRHREMTIENGHTYLVSFKIWADQATRASVKVGMIGPPYHEYWVKVLSIGPQPITVSDTFTMNRDTDPTAELTFHYGGSMATAREPFVICIDDVVLSDPLFVPKPKEKAAEIPKIAVNQLGYFPNASKLAAYATGGGSPLKWELLDGNGQAVASGDTVAFGSDPAAGESVHVIDFSSFTKAGHGYSLRVGTDRSFPFDVESDLYRQLKYDALHYFYHNRSGIEIKMPYAGEEKWARPAGHLTSDRAVGCASDAPCDYRLDVTGGWYDAGDHGKYVVNGGISVWTLLNLWERSKFVGSSFADFGDGKMNIPENKNGQPDLLDEVKWELEWMMKMQVPDGKPKAGMVHHKIHDVSWTALGIAPHDAEQKMRRFLRPPSTAATLNLAANGAQCGRIYRGIDDGLATRCLAAAEKAWAAANANPSVYAPSADTNGGGPYDDKDVTDEFYWAAAELWITTHRDQYKAYVMSSPHHGKFRMDAGGAASSMNWGTTDSLGKISMAVVPQGVDAATSNQMRSQIAQAADEYLKNISTTGYGVPFKGEADGKYPWGSNSFVINNAVVMALANDFTGQRKYFDGALDAMGYLLGRNPLSQCYVSGYGSKPLRWPHHRFWSFQVDKRFPPAPPGCLSGGPNSGLQDPYVQAAGLKGCAPQKCFVDNIEAWSANEITINWNSPLAWVASFLDERGRKLVAGVGKVGPAKPATMGTSSNPAPATPGAAKAAKRKR